MEENCETRGMSSVECESGGDSQLEPIIIVASGDPNELLIEDVLFTIDVKKEFVIGRNTAADLDIPQQAVSRKHCVITFNNGKALITNLSSNGIVVNNRPMKNKNDTRCMQDGDKIFVSNLLPNLCLKYYSDVSHLPVEEYENLKRKGLKRKVIHLENQLYKPKRSKNNNIENLVEERDKLDDSFTKRLSAARKNFNSQVHEITTAETNCFSADDIENKTEQLRAQFLEEKNQIEADYDDQMKELKKKFLEETEKLKSENEKLIDFVSGKETVEAELKKENESLKAELRKAEELIKMGQQELEKENQDKQTILDQVKHLEEVKQEALKKCLEVESMKNFLQTANNELDEKYKSEIECLYKKQLTLEKKISENGESEIIISQMQDELESVRELLNIHQIERKFLENEVETKMKEFAEVFESEFQCTICSEIFVNAVTLLGCFHTFCEFCIKEWKKQKQDCPICRQKINKNQEKRNFLVDSWIGKFIEKMDAPMKAAREDIIQMRAKQGSVIPPRPSTSVPQAHNASVVPPRAPISVPQAHNASVVPPHALTSVPQAHNASVSAIAIGPSVILNPLLPRGGIIMRGRAPRRQARVSAAAPVPARAPRQQHPVVVNAEPIVIPDVYSPPPPPPPPSANPILISDEE